MVADLQSDCYSLPPIKDIDNNSLLDYHQGMQSWTPESIEQFRKRNNLTRRALGELLGCTVNCIYQWERGLREPSRTTEILLSRIEQDFKENAKGKGVKKVGKRNL
jgi:DNA-binding transcriptional regulator YiaG